MAVINPLISATKPSEAPSTVKLHPLVLLTISDYISRHSLTNKDGPVIGAVIGQQNGRQVTMEYAFESAVKSDTFNDGKPRIVMSEPWFGNRLGQYKEVHADPALDLVAAFTLTSPDGPLPDHVPLIQQLKANYNDDVKLILFHPEPILDGSLGGGQLPITIWESLYEPGTETADKGLQVDGWGVGTQLQLKFRQVPFEVQTGEAEMIGVDYVAKGAANASVAVEAGRKPSAAPSLKGKEKARASVADEIPVAQNVLTAEDEELIASLTSKSDAIKMLHARLNLIKKYLSTLPPSYLSDPSLPPAPGVNHVLLRQISSLLSRLPLLSPPSLSSTSDVELVTLLSTLTTTLAATRELNTKSTVVTRARTDKRMAGLARDLDPQGFAGGRGKGAARPHGNGGIGGGGGGGDFSHLDAGFDSGADAGDY